MPISPLTVHGANRRWTPMRLRQQEYPHVGTQTAADISKEKVQPIKWPEVPHRKLIRRKPSRTTRRVSNFLSTSAVQHPSFALGLRVTGLTESTG